MAIHFVADLHFNGDSARHAHPHGFADSAEMTRRICEVWQSRVAPDDTVWILGNVGNPIHLAALPGTKHLVRGTFDPQPWNCLTTGRYASVSDALRLKLPEGLFALVADGSRSIAEDGVLILHGGSARAEDGFVCVSAAAAGWGPVSLDAVLNRTAGEADLRRAA